MSFFCYWIVVSYSALWEHDNSDQAWIEKEIGRLN